MPLQGSLHDKSLPALIELVCKDSKTARLTIDSAGDVGEIYFRDGQVVHAEHGAHSGTEAVYEMMVWEEGSYVVEENVFAPAQTITIPWSELLLEGLKGSLPAGRSERKKNKSSRVVTALKAIPGVEGVIEAAPDLTILGRDLPSGSGEKEANLAVSLGGAGDQVAEMMQLGPLEHAVVNLATSRLLVTKHGEAYVGLLLNSEASPTVVAAAAGNILRS